MRIVGDQLAIANRVIQLFCIFAFAHCDIVDLMKILCSPLVLTSPSSATEGGARVVLAFRLESLKKVTWRRE